MNIVYHSFELWALKLSPDFYDKVFFEADM